MEVTIDNHHDSSFSVAELKNNRAKFKKNVKFSIRSTKEAMRSLRLGQSGLRDYQT